MSICVWPKLNKTYGEEADHFHCIRNVFKFRDTFFSPIRFEGCYNSSFLYTETKAEQAGKVKNTTLRIVM